MVYFCILQAVCLDYGSDTENPINNVCFYSKNNVDKAIYINQEKVSKSVLLITNVIPGDVASICNSITKLRK